MTVKEVIEALKQFDENTNVLINVIDVDGFIDVDVVQEVFSPNGDDCMII